MSFLYSKSSEYIIRALVYLSNFDKEEYIMIKSISEHTNIPHPFLSKIFQKLAAKKWIISKKGKRGGVKLIADSSKLTLMDIIEWSDGVKDFSQCIFGDRECGDIIPKHDNSVWYPEKQSNCILYDKCNRFKAAIIDFFSNTTISEFKEHNSLFRQ